MYELTEIIFGLIHDRFNLNDCPAGYDSYFFDFSLGSCTSISSSKSTAKISYASVCSTLKMPSHFIFVIFFQTLVATHTSKPSTENSSITWASAI